MRKAVIHKSSIYDSTGSRKRDVVETFDNPEFVKDHVGFLPTVHDDFMVMQTTLIAYRVDPEVGRQYQLMKIKETGEYAIGLGNVITEDLIRHVTRMYDGDDFSMTDVAAIDLIEYAKRLTGKKDPEDIFKEGERIGILGGKDRVYFMGICECPGHKESDAISEFHWVTKSELDAIIEEGNVTAFLEAAVPHLPW